MKLTHLRRPRKARIEIIPMIDTIFFLLVFYILSSLAMTTQRGLNVQLPPASTGAPSPSQSPLVVTITRDNRYFINRAAVPPAALALALQKQKGAHPSVLINADLAATHRAVVRALDAARSAGLTQVSIATQPVEAARLESVPAP